MCNTEQSAHGPRPDLALRPDARVLELEERQDDHVECLNATDDHAPVQVVNWDSDVRDKPVDAFPNMASPVLLPRCRARATRALPLERCSAAVPLEIDDRCLD